MKTTGKSEPNTSTGGSTQSAHDAESLSRLMRASILQSVEDAVKAKGSRQRVAMTYICSRDFTEDCRQLGLDSAAIGKLVIALLDLDDGAKAEEITKLKHKLRVS